MANGFSSLSNMACSLSCQDELFSQEYSRPRTPLPEMSPSDLDDLSDWDKAADPSKDSSPEVENKPETIQVVAIHDTANVEPEDALEQVTKLRAASVPSKDDVRPLLGIPRADITAYPLETANERPSKRTRFTKIEAQDDADFESFRTLVLHAYAKFMSLDPSYERRIKLAEFLEMGFKDIDDWFRSARNAPPTASVADSEHFLDQASTATRSNFEDGDCFTQGDDDTASRTRTTVSTPSRPYSCTFRVCGETFKSPSEWRRHEEDVHWPQHKFMCVLCAISQTDDQDDFTCTSCSEPFSTLIPCIDHVLSCGDAKRQYTARRKRFTGLDYHIKTEHHGEIERAHAFEKARSAKDWHYPVESYWPRSCTFPACSKPFEDWKERSDHYTNLHFLKSRRSSRKSVVSTQDNVGGNTLMGI